MIRIFDFIFSLFGIMLLLPLLILLFIIGLFDTGSPLFFQRRVGKNKKSFTLMKFRTMRPQTQSVATHLVNKSAITSFGSFLRKSKLDELPQLINVFFGDMSLVGPRPNLFNQEELIEERDKRGIYKVRPGITGLAQIKEIDMSTPKLLAETDLKMIQELTLLRYFSFILATVSGKGAGDRVK
jgi:lipopolysaccharide/colanic/teichoic acid biosynthesis glycosyltransferase